MRPSARNPSSGTYANLPRVSPTFPLHGFTSRVRARDGETLRRDSLRLDTGLRDLVPGRETGKGPLRCLGIGARLSWLHPSYPPELVHLEPDGKRLVAYLERRTQWDSLPSVSTLPWTAATPEGYSSATQTRDRAGPAESDRRIQIVRPPQDRRPRADPVRERTARHATAPVDLGEAVPQRHAPESAALDMGLSSLSIAT